MRKGAVKPSGENHEIRGRRDDGMSVKENEFDSIMKGEGTTRPHAPNR